MKYLERVQKLQTNLQSQQVFLLSRPADVQYYTGLVNLNPEERESFLVVSKKGATLLYPSFSPVEKVSDIEYHPGHWPSDLVEVLTSVIERQHVSEILIDKSSLFLNEYEALKDLKVSFTELKNEIIWQQRMAKDAEEVELLEKAGSITSKVMAAVLKNLKLGVTEKAVARQVEIETRTFGAETSSFPPVVAFGDHSALPHHQPTDTVLKENMVVLVDMGAKFSGYCGDMTRTVWFGSKPSKKFLEIEKTVKLAYEAALKKVKAEVSGAAVDLAARGVIKKAGYGDKFIHTTGHGVGLEIHEQPSLYHKKEIVIPENAVVTIEPGIYIDGEFGYRYENMVLVKEKSSNTLT